MPKTASVIATRVGQVIEGCQVEVHRDRGVVYVHGPVGGTLIRISGLDAPVLRLADENGRPDNMLDVNGRYQSECVPRPKWRP